MADSFKKAGYGKLPAQLRQDQTLPKRAGHLFAIMGSYGPESRAKVETLAADLGVRAPLVRELQKALQAAGWIFLLREGGGRAKQGDGRTREWWLNDFPWQHLNDPATAETIAAIQSGNPTEKNPGSNRKGSAKVPSSKEPPHIDNNNQPNNITKHEAIATFCRGWREKYGKAYSVTGPDQGRLASLLKGGIGKAEFEEKVVAYLANEDQFTRGLKHPLSLLCSQFNRWESKVSGTGEGLA